MDISLIFGNLKNSCPSCQILPYRRVCRPQLGKIWNRHGEEVTPVSKFQSGSQDSGTGPENHQCESMGTDHSWIQYWTPKEISTFLFSLLKPVHSCSDDEGIDMSHKNHHCSVNERRMFPDQQTANINISSTISLLISIDVKCSTKDRSVSNIYVATRENCRIKGRENNWCILKLSNYI